MQRIRMGTALLLASICLAGFGDPLRPAQASYMQDSSPGSTDLRVISDRNSKPAKIYPFSSIDKHLENSLSNNEEAPSYWDKPILELCDLGKLLNCQLLQRPGFPPAPPGYEWKRVDGLFTFSAYAHPTEADYPGDLVDIPGIQGLEAKEDFLFALDGIGMQGGGYIHRVYPRQGALNYYIKYISGHWELGNEDVIIEDEWYFARDHSPVNADQFSRIRLKEAKFSIMPDPQLIPYYSVAASTRFEIGTQIYVPGLAAYGGLFEVQDRGGAFSKDSQRFDIYVGSEMETALEWIRLDRARSNLPVYVLEKSSE